MATKVEKVICGGNFTIIMDEKGKLFSFGDNRYGQLGITGLNNIILEHPSAI
jgi:alpha-tubulin suppressor-like RCC1 family protein